MLQTQPLSSTQIHWSRSPTIDAAVQVSNAALNVNEGAGFAEVTVTRIGDGSRTATVNYSTTDTAGLQNCTLANGKASGDAVLWIPAARPGHDWLRQLGHYADSRPEQLQAYDLRLFFPTNIAIASDRS